MRYFIDTEFIEDSKTIDLISIGIAAQDGRTYYAISTEFDESRASDWVRDNVLKHLPDRRHPAWKSRSQIRKEIVALVGDDRPAFYGYYADYDWVVFCWLFGRMIDLPNNFPKYCRDLKQMLDDIGNPKVPFEPEREHDALSDAEWNRRLYSWIEQQKEAM